MQNDFELDDEFDDESGKGKKKLFLVDIIVPVIILAILGVGVFLLSRSINTDGSIKEVILEETAEESTEPVVTESGYYIYNEDDMKLFQTYADYNSDVVGYITIEGTVLDHPMMWTPDDEDYYLYRDLDKNYNSHGVPFLSATSQIENLGTNMVVYGHNIHKLTSDVFCVIAEYEDLDYYKEHPIIKTISKSGTRYWLIFAYFIVDNSDSNPFKYSDYTDFQSKQDFEDFMRNVRVRNWLDTDTEIEFGDTLITLSSCSRELSGSGTNRMVLVGKCLEVGEEYGDIVEDATMASSPLLPEKLR